MIESESQNFAPSSSPHHSSPGTQATPAYVPPPWQLTGTAVLFVQGWRSLLSLIHYASSPVGPYDELAVSAVGVQGPTVIEMYVNSADSMLGGRVGWGFPKQLARLQWHRLSERVVFQYGNRVWRVRLCGPVFPLRAHFWTAQVLHRRWVRVPINIKGRARFGFQGRRIALVLESFEMTVLPPRAIN